jgi:hypothetical protein
MSNQSDDLFVGEQAAVTGAIRISILEHMRPPVLPDNRLCLWEHITKQFILVGQLNFDSSTAKFWVSCVHLLPIKLQEAFFGSVSVFEFNIAVHGLGSRSFHDDMNRTARGMVLDDVWIAPHEHHDLVLRDFVWDLRQYSVRLSLSCQSRTHIQDLQDAICGMTNRLAVIAKQIANVAIVGIA